MAEQQLIFKRRVTPKKAGGYLLALPGVLAAFLGCAEGGDVALVVDTKAPVPSLIIRPAEAPSQ